MIIHLVRFTSALPGERVQELFELRAHEYERVPGLLQKYYLRYETGEYGGVYVWDSPASMRSFRASELSRSICDVYRVQESTIDVAEVVLEVRARSQLA